MTPSIISRNRLARAVLPPIFWLGVWQAAAMYVGQELLIPAPAAVARTVVELAATAPFWQTVGLSLGRVLAGLAVGTGAGAVLAVLTCASPWADALLSPAVRVIRATPVVSFILLVLLWTRRDLVPVVVSMLMVLPVIWGNVTRGIREIDPKLLELARVLRFGRGKTAWLIAVPAVRPYFLSAVTTAMGLAWKAGVAAEVLCLPKLAIGTQVSQSRLNLETPALFAWTLTVIALSLALERLLSVLLARLNGGWRS